MYWPLKDQCLNIGKYEVKLIELIKEKNFKIRKLSLKNNETGEEKEVAQYQFIGWPDGDRPLEKHYKSILKLVKITASHLEKIVCRQSLACQADFLESDMI